MPRRSPAQDYDEPLGLVGSTIAMAARRPFDALACALAAACTVMIFVNALMLQQGRPVAPSPVAVRAAPQSAAPAHRVEAPKRSDLVEQVQTALAERGLYDGVVDGLKGDETVTAIRAFEQSQSMAPTGEASEKILAALMTAPIRKGESAAAAQKAAAAARAQTQAPASTGSTSTTEGRLMAAQRALAKIGYGPVSIDGKMGAETRNAIKAFERDRGMPETGELTPPVVRALAAQTGAQIQ